MTATDELRRLLDERGVEYEGGERSLRWRDRYGIMMQAFPLANGELGMGVWSCTPEQAIAVTLGRGECKVDVLNTGDCAGYECSEYIMHCNGCGHEFGHVLYNEDGDVWMSEPPNYCPNCGRKVVTDG